MGTRADDRDGSCREVAKGKHAGKWRVQHTLEDQFGRKTRLSRIFPTKAEGKDFLRSLRRGVRIEEVQRRRELTLGSWFDWLAEHDWPDSLAETTIAARKARFKKYVRKEWGGVAMERLDPIAIKAFYVRLAADGVGQPTLLELKRDLVRVFNQAIKPYHRVPWHCGNPFSLHVAAPPRRDAVALSPEEAARAIRCARLAPRERAMLATFLLAGLRLGEQMALTRGQLRFDQGLIAVDRAVRINPRRGQSVGPPKGGKPRAAVMCPTLAAALREVAGDLAEDACVWPCEDRDEPRLKRNVYRTWKGIVEKAGLPPDMSPHDCRLTHVNWIEKLLPEVSPTTLKEHVGHASGRTVTEINYTRPLTPAQDILRNGIERLISAEDIRRSPERREETVEPPITRDQWVSILEA